MKEMSDSFPNIVYGLSDHTISNHACFGAVALGASILERHFTDSMQRSGPDIVCSMDPIAASELLEGVSILFDQRGGKKGALKEEQATIDFAFSTIVTIAPIKKGDLFTKDNIWVKRPGTGEILAEHFNDLLGKRASDDIPIDHHVNWKNIEK